MVSTLPRKRIVWTDDDHHMATHGTLSTKNPYALSNDDLNHELERLAILPSIDQTILLAERDRRRVVNKVIKKPFFASQTDLYDAVMHGDHLTTAEQAILVTEVAKRFESATRTDFLDDLPLGFTERLKSLCVHLPDSLRLSSLVSLF